MSRDPIVEGIHEIRRKTMEECGNHPRRYFARLKATEAKDHERLVSKIPPTTRRPLSPG